MRVNCLPLLRRDLAERAEAAAEEVADLDEAAAGGEVLRRLFLCRSPLKPPWDVVPVHATIPHSNT